MWCPQYHVIDALWFQNEHRHIHHPNPPSTFSGSDRHPLKWKNEKNDLWIASFQLSKTHGIFRFCCLFERHQFGPLFFCQGPSKNHGMALVGTSPCCSSWRVSFGSLSWWSMAWKWHFASEKTVNILTKENHEGEGKGGKIVRALGTWSVGC